VAESCAGKSVSVRLPQHRRTVNLVAALQALHPDLPAQPLTRLETVLGIDAADAREVAVRTRGEERMATAGDLEAQVAHRSAAAS